MEGHWEVSDLSVSYIPGTHNYRIVMGIEVGPVSPLQSSHICF